LHKLYWIIFGIWLCQNSKASGQELYFHHYTMEDGLSIVETHSPGRTLQDKEGFIWFATMDGLVRFDGATFKKYRFSLRNPYSLGNNQTTAICQAKDGKIWVGTGSAGIYVFDPKTEFFEAVQHRADDPASLCGDGINFLGADEEGNVWVGTRFNGICKYVAEEERFQSYGSLFQDGNCFYQQKKGTIWIGSTEGLSRYLPDTDSFERFPLNPQQPSNRKQNVVFDIAEDGLGRLWTTSNYNGLHLFDLHRSRFQKLPEPVLQGVNNKPSALSSDLEGNIWISGLGKVYRYQVQEQKLSTFLHDTKRRSSCPPVQITDLFVDEAGSLWLTARGHGISVVHTLNHPFEIISDFPIKHFEYFDSTNILISTPEGVQLFDIQRKMIKSLELPDVFSTPSIGEILFTSQKELWASDHLTQMLYSWNFETAKTRAFPIGTMFFKEDRKGTIWGSTKLLYFDKPTETWRNKHSPFSQRGYRDTLPNNPLDIEVDTDDRIWISSDSDGLRMYDPAADSIYAYRHQLGNPNSIASNILYDLRAASNGKMYAGTIHGLSIIDTKRDTIINITESEGLVHNQIQAIVEDVSGNIWLAVKGGLARVDAADLTVKNYSQADGLPKHFFTTYFSFRDDKGNLYFSTTAESFRFHPDSLKADSITAPTYLLDFYLNQKSVVLTDSNSVLQQKLRYLKKLELNYRQTDFGFSFTTPIFKNTNFVKYFYQLEGYDEDWQWTSDHQVHYTNIDPGSYTFRVKAQNSDGIWTTQEASISIIVHPPWWQTGWAYLFYVLIISGTVYYFYRFNLSRQLAKQEATQIKALNQLKSRFYTNITHEFRTPLTVILGMNREKDNPKAQDLIERNGKKLLQLINQLLNLSKIDTGNLSVHYQQIEIVSFTQYIGESFQSLAEQKYIRLTIYSEIKQLYMDMDEEKYSQIISNLLSNAIKFTPESGKIILHLSQKENQLVVKVTDNGIGISPEALPHIFDRFYQVENTASRQGKGTGIGLALVKELVQLMDGTISAESEDRIGTTFSLQFPIRQTAPQKQTAYEHITVDRSIVDEVEVLATEQATELPILLIIEDNADVVIYIQSLLSQKYEILIAANGEEGIEKAIEHSPDIIISDVMMPKKNGFEVVETLKQDIRTSHIPIILLTAKATQEDKLEGLKHGADAYLMKPFDKQELFIRLKNLIEVRLQLRQKYATFQPQLHPPTNPEEEFLQQVHKQIEANYIETEFSVETLAESLHMSRVQLYRKLKAISDQTPSQLIRTFRLEKAKALLANEELNISEIAYEVGYSDPNYFIRQFTKVYKQSPNTFRKNL